jgi:hypothetical protein
MSPSKFKTIPSLSTLQALVNVYFKNCHDQPYSFFREDSLRQNLQDGSLPDYLLMALVATTARYSSHPCFENRQKEAIEIYSGGAWHKVLQEVFSSEQILNLQTVQATCLLAVIEFTGKCPTAHVLDMLS